MSEPITLKDLTAEDAVAYRALRLEALEVAAESFGSSVEEERERTLDEFRARIEDNHVVGAYAGKSLCGMAGFYTLDRLKTAHRGVIWGVYVRPAFRGRGIARLLIEDLLVFASTKVEQVHLAVVVGNAAALHLYESLGFRIYGTEPRALRIAGRDYDEHLMVKRFAESDHAK